ncbi:MAG: DUF362 domain-containing protein [bacterium]
MKAKVFFLDMRVNSEKSMLDKLEKAMLLANVDKIASKGELVAVKMHFGERGCTSYIRPIFIRKIVDVVKRGDSLPFLTDTNTLYVGSRSNSVDHIRTAVQNGYSFAAIEVPIVIADGLRGTNCEEVEIDKREGKKVKIASDIVHADALVVVTHVKGHELTGVGGALKNLGMGCAGRAGKLEIHSGVEPKISSACVGCGRCIEWCPSNAITLKRKKARIAREICIGCAECIVVCPNHAIKIDWKWDGEFVQRRMVEYALGVIKEKKGKVCFINFITDVSPQCDCYGFSDASVVQDIGIAVSNDPVAIDKASLDLINNSIGLPGTVAAGLAAGEDKFKAIHKEIDWSIQIKHAEHLGLGTASYQLVRVY